MPVYPPADGFVPVFDPLYCTIEPVPPIPPIGGIEECFSLPAPPPAYDCSGPEPPLPSAGGGGGGGPELKNTINNISFQITEISQQITYIWYRLNLCCPPESSSSLSSSSSSSSDTSSTSDSSSGSSSINMFIDMAAAIDSDSIRNSVFKIQATPRNDWRCVSEFSETCQHGNNGEDLSGEYIFDASLCRLILPGGQDEKIYIYDSDVIDTLCCLDVSAYLRIIVSEKYDSLLEILFGFRDVRSKLTDPNLLWAYQWISQDGDDVLEFEPHKIVSGSLCRLGGEALVLRDKDENNV